VPRQLPHLVLALMAVVFSCSGCGPSDSPTSPSVPPTVAAPVPPSGPQPTYTLSGVVTEMSAEGPKPVADVEVYCDSCGSPVGHTFAYPDAQGLYSFSWAANGVHPLLVRKAGYGVTDPTTTYPDGTGVRNVTVNGDTRFDIQMSGDDDVLGERLPGSGGGQPPPDRGVTPATPPRYRPH